MEKYPWPGNVRELRASIERAVVMANGPKITLRDLPPTVREGAAAAPVNVGGIKLPPVKAGNRMTLQDTENRMIARAMEETGGNVTAAAKMLGLEPANDASPFERTAPGFPRQHQRTLSKSTQSWRLNSKPKNSSTNSSTGKGAGGSGSS
jgi:transcriptional regulator with GAF, ATPase, and Fis domain